MNSKIKGSPSTNNDNTQHLCNLLQEVDEINPSHLLIVGDFNFPEVDWSNYYSNAPQNHRSHIFINKILDVFLYQHITEYTRYREGQNPSLPDLILTNEEGMVNDIQYVSPLGKSDHVCLVFNINMYASTVENIKPRYAYQRAKYENISENLKQIDWCKRLENINAENALVFFEEVLNNEMEKYIPKNRTEKRRPYINKHAERKI